jgi:PAS domain S-box-containing protein
LLILTQGSILKTLTLARRNARQLAERNAALQTEIAERQQAELALRESEQRYRTLFELESDAITLIDVETMRLVDVNTATVQRYGFSRAELLTLRATDLSAEPEQTHQAIATGQEMAYIPLRYHRTKDGRVFPVEITGRFFDHHGKKLLLVAMRDIAERVKADAALKSSEKKFSLAFHATPSLMAIKRASDQTYVEVNRAFLDQLHYRQEDVIGKTPLELGLYHDPGQFALIAAQMQATGRVTDLEIAVCTQDRRILTLLFSAELIEIDGEAFILTLGHDITERKQAQEALRRMNDELERRVAERTAELTATNQELQSFSYSVAHDLRTPLRAIDGFSRMLLEDHAGQIDSDGRFYLERIIAANQRMSQLIDDLLKLSRLARSELARQPVNMSQLAGEILHELALSNPQRVVEWQIADDLTVSADPQMLRVVLENLLVNAWKFTAQKPLAHIELGVQPGRKRTFFVRDNGAGFDMTYANKLFGAFQRLHAASEFPGSGVGLATVKRIIERHGGEVWAAGEVNGGATFFFTLP